MGLIHRLKYRSLRVDILTIFLCLLAVSSLLIISLSYSKNSKSIFRFSKQTIELASSLIVERIATLIEDAERLSEMSVHLLLRPDDISEQNQELIFHMLSIVRFYPNLFGLYYGTPSGSTIEVFNLKAMGATASLSDPSQPLPPKSAYVLWILNRAATAPETLWIYLDENLKPLQRVTVPGIDYDPRTRPWYQDAMHAVGPQWTDVYEYFVPKKPGITVSQAAYDSEGHLVAVAGADLSLEFLSKFVEERVIGKSGEAFIVDENGKIVSVKNSPSRVSPDIVESAYRDFQQEKKVDLAFKVSTADYLASIHPFPPSFHHAWSIVVVAPLSDFFASLIEAQHEVTLISIAIVLLASILVVYFSKRISGPIVALTRETDKIKQLDFDHLTRVQSNVKEIILMDESLAKMGIALSSFSRYIPKKVVTQLIERGHEIAIGGEKQEITILFSDVTGFTSISESHPTEQVFETLSEYFSILSRIFLQFEGTIDKYLGDGMMVFWNAPVEVKNHAAKACAAALKCQAEIQAFNERNKRLGKPVFLTRFGIHTGTAIVGNIGTVERMNYTAMGDAVNIAARLQPLNKIYHTSILISEETKQRLGGEFETRVLDLVELRGKKEKTQVYELIPKSVD